MTMRIIKNRYGTVLSCPQCGSSIMVNTHNSEDEEYYTETISVSYNQETKHVYELNKCPCCGYDKYSKMKFKAGDRVKFIGCTDGKIYTISVAHQEKVYELAGIIGFYREDSMEIVNE